MRATVHASGEVETPYARGTIEEVRKIRDAYERVILNDEHRFGGYGIKHFLDLPFILFGCSSEGQKMSISDLNKVLKAYEELNK